MTASLSSNGCPKCGWRPRETDSEKVSACARCGLVFERWTPELAAEQIVMDDEGESLWAAVQASWNDDSTHDAFLKHCSLSGRLALAGRRYRERLDQAPKDPTAGRMQERVVSMATLTFAQRAPKPIPVTRTRMFWAVLACFVGIGIVSALLYGR
jgi:hypothetical protein